MAVFVASMFPVHSLRASNPNCQTSGGVSRNSDVHQEQANSQSFALAKDWNSSLTPQIAVTPSTKTYRTRHPSAAVRLSPALAAPAGAVAALVNPSTIDENYYGFVELSVTGLANGDTVRVDKYQVTNTAGTIDAGAILEQSFLLTDGQSNLLAGKPNVNIAADTTPADGSITAELNFLDDYAPNAIGEYVYRISSPTSAFAPVTTRLTVTDAADDQSFSGTVLDNGTPVANAHVVLLDPTGGGYDFVAATLADGAGKYLLGTDPGIYDLVAIKRGYVGALGPSVAHRLSANIDQAVDLTLLPGTQTISGKVRDRATPSIALPGIQVVFRSKDGRFTVDYTDETGTFNTLVTPGEWEVEVDRKAVNQVGYLAPSTPLSVDTTAGGAGNLNIDLPKATALFYGHVTDANSASMPQVEMDAGSADGKFQAFAVTDPAGNYVMAVGQGDWFVAPTAGALEEMGLVAPQAAERMIDAGSAQQVDFIVPSTVAHLRGTLRDETDASIDGMTFDALEVGGKGGYLSFRTEPDGTFDIGLTEGKWKLVPNIDDAADSGWIFVLPSVHTYDLAVGQTIANVDLRVQHPTRQIVVQVLDDTGAPYEDAEVSVRSDVGDKVYFAYAFTDRHGMASLPAFDGTWRLFADGEEIGADGFLPVPEQQVVVNGADRNAAIHLVVDTNPPVIQSGPPTQVAHEGESIGDYRTLLVTTDENAVTVTQDPPVSFVPHLGTVTITLTATDTAGNESDFTFDVEVRPLEALTGVTIAQGADAPGAGGASGLPGDAKMAGFGVPAIDDAGNVAFLGNWTSDTEGRGSGLFTGTACLAKVGGEAPGLSPAIFRSVSDPVVNNGNVAFLATLSGVPAASSGAVFLGTAAGPATVIAQSGQAAPDTGGAQWKTFKGLEVQGENVLLFAQLATGTGDPRVAAANDYGLWIKSGAGPFKLVVREGAQVGLGTVKTLVSFKCGNGSPGQGRGWLTTPGGVPSALAYVIYTDRTQGVLNVKTDGLASPLLVTDAAGYAGGDYHFATFTGLGLPAANSAGQIACLGTTTVDDGVNPIVKGRHTLAMDFDGSGHFKEVAFVGGNTGLGESTFSALKDPVLSSDGVLAFPATIKGAGLHGPAAATLWAKHGTLGNLKLVAQGGPRPVAQPIPGLPITAQWSGFSSLAIAKNSGALFVATLVPGKGGISAATATGVWSADTQGVLHRLFQAGISNVDLGPAGGVKRVKSFSLLTATVGSTGVVRSFSDTGKVVWRATFEDRSQAIVTTAIP